MSFVRILCRLIFAVYGPLGPIVVVFVVTTPVLILLTGWPWLFKLLALALDVLALLLTAVLLGPAAMAEIRAFYDHDPTR